MDALFNVTDIVKRAKEVMGFKTDVELANYLGVSRSTLSNWCARNSIDFPLLLEKMKEVDYNWLLVERNSSPRYTPLPVGKRIRERWKLYTFRKHWR